MEQSNIIELTVENLEQLVVETSRTHLLIVGFWTPRDPGGVEMMDHLSAIVADVPNDAVFGKCNVDEQQQVAMRFGIQSVPTIALLKDGRPIDSFVGVKDLAELKAFVQPHLPKPEDGFLAQAKTLIEQGEHRSAFGVAKQAFELDPERLDIKLVFADCCIRNGKVADAETLLQSIKMIDQDTYYQSLMSAVELAKTAADTPQVKALQAQLAQVADDDVQAKNTIRVQLAVQLNQSQRSEEALAMLFGVLQQDMNFGDAKKSFLDILATLPDGDPLALDYRRKMYSLLY